MLLLLCTYALRLSLGLAVFHLCTLNAACCAAGSSLLPHPLANCAICTAHCGRLSLEREGCLI